MVTQYRDHNVNYRNGALVLFNAMLTQPAENIDFMNACGEHIHSTWIIAGVQCLIAT